MTSMWLFVFVLAVWFVMIRLALNRVQNPEWPMDPRVDDRERERLTIMYRVQLLIIMILFTGTVLVWVWSLL